MGTALDSGIVGGHAQRDRRTHWVALDQHGRQWETILDVTAKPKPGPTQPWNPYGWDAPLVPDQKYLRWNAVEMGKLVIDYVSWKKDRRAADEEWLTELHIKATEMSPSDGGASLLGNSRTGLYEDASPALLRAAGKRRLPVEPVIAAEQGNSWVLGKSNRVDLRLVGFFPIATETEADYSDEPQFQDEYQDLEDQVDPQALGGKTVKVEAPKQTWNQFLKEQMQAGKSMKEAAEIWNKQKAA